MLFVVQSKKQERSEKREKVRTAKQKLTKTMERQKKVEDNEHI